MIHNEECGPFVRGISIDPKPSYHNLHNAHVAFWAALGIYGVTFRICRTRGLLEHAIQVIKNPKPCTASFKRSHAVHRGAASRIAGP